MGTATVIRAHPASGQALDHSAQHQYSERALNHSAASTTMLFPSPHQLVLPRKHETVYWKIFDEARRFSAEVRRKQRANSSESDPFLVVSSVVEALGAHSSKQIIWI